MLDVLGVVALVLGPLCLIAGLGLLIPPKMRPVGLILVVIATGVLLVVWGVLVWLAGQIGSEFDQLDATSNPGHWGERLAKL